MPLNNLAILNLAPSFTIDAPLTAPNNILLLSLSPISQSSPITATGLALIGNGPFVLDNESNAVSKLVSSDSGPIKFTDSIALNIGSLTGPVLGQISGVSSSGIVALSAPSITQTQPLSASAISLAGGNVTLTNSENSFGSIGADVTGNLSVFDSSALTVGAVDDYIGIFAGGSVFLHSTGDLTLDAHSADWNAFAVAGSGAGDAIVLATEGKFTNSEITYPALSVLGGGGRWLVYSHDPANDTIPNLSPDFKQYNAVLGSTVAQAAGNGLVYSIAPMITASLIGATKTYDGLTTATLSPANFSFTGAIQNDTVDLMSSHSTFGDPNVNTGIAVTATGVSIVSAANGSIPVYGYQLASATASGNIGTITPATLTYTSNAGSRTYGANNPVFSGTVTGFVNGQSRESASTGSAAFTSPATATSNVGGYAINGSGLAANNGNYVFSQAEANSSALTINPASAVLHGEFRQPHLW